jgi:predicted metal-dependent phosphotriesterase family hydrolase
LSHDHLIVDAFRLFGEATGNYGWILDDVDVAIAEVERFRDAGGAAICDPTNIGIGRNPLALKRISDATGVHIVMGSGWYRERCYEQYVYQEMPDALADRLTRELLEGVDNTGVRAGFIGEIGTERHAISPAQERVFRAAARAHRRTGSPIMTHTTHFGELALEQLALLAEEGVDPSHVIVSHLGDRVGVDAILPIAERGPWLSIDNLGFISGYAPLEVRADNIAALWSEGLGDRVLLSNDICLLDQLRRYGGPGYANVIENFFPLLRRRGLSEEQLRTMTVSNPARAFAYNAKPSIHGTSDRRGADDGNARRTSE